MITRHHGPLAVSPRAILGTAPDRRRERERLRRELLRRILDRELRRQALRGERR